jgi:acyl-coenzyme A thioesterase 13
MTPGFAMPFMDELGVEIISAGGGAAELRLVIRPAHRNAFGGAHGGLIAALIDVAVGAAAAIDAAEPGLRPNLTLSLTTQYLRPAPGEGVLTARARLRGGGAQTAFVDCDVLGPDGARLAVGTATLQYAGP